MAIYLYDGVMCPAFYLTGNPRRAAYLYDTPEGQEDFKIKVSNSLVFVPDDDGDSWTAADGPTGANMVLAAPDDLDTAGLQAVNDRLVRAYNNKERCAAERLGGATHGTGTYDPSTPFAKPPEEATTESLETWQTWQVVLKPDGTHYSSRAEWRAAGKPKA